MQAKKSTKENKFNLPVLLKKRLFLVIACALLFTAAAGGIVSLILAGNRDASDRPGGGMEGAGQPGEQEAADEAYVLPQQVRSENLDGESSWQLWKPVTDPFAQPLKLTGIITGGRGGSTAIIEAGGFSYIVFEGDYVEDFWAVRLIAGDMVVLRGGDQEIFLYFDQPPVTKTLEPAPGVEDTEEGA